VQDLKLHLVRHKELLGAEDEGWPADDRTTVVTEILTSSGVSGTFVVKNESGLQGKMQCIQEVVIYG
jgi:hypothetical protein